MADIELSKFVAGSAPYGDEHLQSIGGLASQNGEPWVLYGIQWIPDKIKDHGAAFNFSFPAWEGEPIDGERVDARLELLVYEGKPGLHIVDSPDGGLERDEVLATEIHEQLIDLTRAIWDSDPNLDEVRSVLGRPILETEPAPAGLEAPQFTQGPSFLSTDADIESYRALAQANWPRFVDAWTHRDGDVFLVKQSYEDGEQSELLWSIVRELDVDGRVARGVLDTPPDFVTNIQQNDEVEVPFDAVADWLVLKHDNIYAGGYSNPNEDPEERERRAAVDALGLPQHLLLGFSGLDLRNPLPDLSETNVARLLSDDADRTPLRRPAARVLVMPRTRPDEQQDLLVEADDGEVIPDIELLRKIHPVATEVLRGDPDGYLAVLLCVGQDPEGRPAYLLVAGPDQGGLLAGRED